MGRATKSASAGVYRGAVLAVAIVLCAAYSFTGTHRVVNGGLAIFQGDSIIIWMASRSLQYNVRGFELGLLALSYPWLSAPLKVGYFVTTIFEVLSPIALINASFRKLWLFVILPFHFFTLLTMNIFFWENMLLLALFVGGIGYVLHPPQLSSQGSLAQAENRNAAGTSVILFDGVCNLCNRWVRFVIEHDPNTRFSFASLQSDFGQRVLRSYHAPAFGVRSLVLLEDGRCYVRSGAVLRIARHLSGPWRLLGAFTWVPRPMRDAVYDWIARNRYGWFGRTDYCPVPSPELAERFLDERSHSNDPLTTSGHHDSVPVSG
jgi:predicted DCC family thiol-disulfide oxidoreductase YuxK